ncbi:MAG: HipA domain-containing protein [Chloroflexi bacterium]|nr:HipA domain-containing protein [Chloroflexota bacterium]
MPERMRVLVIHLGDRRVGHLANYNGRTVFLADPDYVVDARRPVLSQAYVGEADERSRSLLSNPKNSLNYAAIRLPPFFTNLLPEGALRARIAAEVRVHEDAEFELLAATGGDLPGAITATPTDRAPAAARSFFGVSVDVEVGQQVGRPTSRFSLSGVQLKFSVLRDPRARYTLATEGQTGSIIVKLPHPAYPFLPENEFTSMRLAQLAGVETPEFWLDDVRALNVAGLAGMEGKLLAIRRFDREAGRRIHIEDFAQVLGLRPAEKYGHTNYDTILRIILARTREGLRDLRQLTRRLVVDILLGNGDAHAKNISLLYQDPLRPDLAPAYDIVSTVQYLPDDETLALNLAGERRTPALAREHFQRLARRIELPNSRILLREVQATVERARATWPAALPDLPMAEHHKAVILRRLETLPIAQV